MKAQTKLITVVAVAGTVGACAPAPAGDDAHGASSSCAGKCDGAREADELRYGERREVGPVGEFGIQADWTEVVEMVVAPQARARLSLEPLDGSAMPELTVYRDLGTSIEHVAEGAEGVLEVEGASAEERYVVEIYGPPNATGGAILELQCVHGECGPEVEVTVSEQRLRDTPTELLEIADASWNLFRVEASRATAEAIRVAQVAERVALTPAAAESLARDEGAGDWVVTGAPVFELSELGAYPGGEEVLDVLSDFLDPQGSRYELRYGEATVVYELEGAGGETVDVVQEVAVLLFASQTDDTDLAVSVDELAVL